MCSRAHTHFIKTRENFIISGEKWGWSSCQASTAVLPRLQLATQGRHSISAHGPPPPSWITNLCAPSARSLHLSSRYVKHKSAQPFPLWDSGLKGLVRGLCTQTLWASETRLNTKEKIRLYYPDSILISQELIMSFNSDKKKERRKGGSEGR